MTTVTMSDMYPPKVPTFMPAFLDTESPKVYYELSPYMSVGNARRLHISIVNQDTNESVVNQGTGIIITDGLEWDEIKQSYFVTIPVEQIKNDSGAKKWLTNCYYKLQIRFDSYDAGHIDNNDAYFTQHLDYFSEWSSVCLLRAIPEPTLLLNNFDLAGGHSQEIVFNKGIIPLTGQVFFGEELVPSEKDEIQSFRVCVLPRDKLTPIYKDSGEIFTSRQVNPNSLNYNLDLAGIETKDDQTKFRIRIYYLTRNQYQAYKDYYITIAEFVADDSFNPKLSVDMDDEVGIASLTIENWMSVFGTLYVRRSSSLSNFKDWEMIREEIVAGPIRMTIKDSTVQSGTWYRYIVQFKNIRGGITPIVYSAKFIPNFYGPFISRMDTQAHLLYDYTISSMKPVVTRQKIDTVGGKYPKFAENAMVNYKQFSISGLISSQEDEHKTFLKEKDYFGEEMGNYGVYLEENDIIPDYNQLWERAYRDELIAWLNDGEPKLYRSQPEGNMVVMIYDINLTPITSMSRRVWNFSATMVEVENAQSLTKLDELGIYNCITLDDKKHITLGPGGEEEEIPDYVDVTTVGQIVKTQMNLIREGNVDIISNYLMPKLQMKYAGILAKRFPIDGYLTNVKIQFYSKPHLFLQRNPSAPLLLIEDPSRYSEEERAKMLLGYSFQVNDQGLAPTSSKTFFVGPKGYFQIPNNIDVTSLFFPQGDDEVGIDFLFHYKEKNDVSKIVTGSNIEKVLVAQDSRTYVPDKWMGDLIRRRHTYLVPGKFFQRMEWWRGISVDCAPYAMFEVLYDGDVLGDQTVLETGFTGVLNLLKTVPTADMRFIGRRMHKIDYSRQRFAEDWEYCNDPKGTNYANVYDITKPEMHVVYTIDGKPYIYYTNHKFYEVERQDRDMILAKVPVDGLLNYYGSVIRDSYE